MSDEERVLDDFIHQTVIESEGKRLASIEERIRILLQPKPRWLPEWAYRRILARLLVLETGR